MEYNIFWQPKSKESYLNEIDFIFLKWNHKEVEKFILLVNNNLFRLSKNHQIGIPIGEVYRLVISKQTTSFYQICHNKNQINLLYFWNNSKNPDDLTKLL